jgi:magnesium transporter
MPNVF